jgi:hypothetical protein
MIKIFSSNCRKKDGLVEAFPLVCGLTKIDGWDGGGWGGGLGVGGIGRRG